MREDTFDLGLTGLLLFFGGWYALHMYAAPANAGRVPTIVAAVMLVALVIQGIQQLRRRRSSAVGPDAPATEGPATPDLALAILEDVPEPQTYNEPEPDTYDTLIALDRGRRRRLLIVIAFSVAFYFGVVLVGFVVTSGVLIFAIYRLSGERLRTAVLGGVVGMLAVYALVVWILNLPALRGTLIN
jgi:hypothetical protein